MNIVIGMLGAAWLAILLMLAWGAAGALYRLLQATRPLPFFALIEHHGLSLDEMERAVGADALARALRRCADCTRRRSCDGDLAACPNAPLFYHARAFTVAVS
ncbi:MAG TPA: hypothetical protein VFR66_05925 [Burkholderiales bacterium]|nr:hypothetical protein [Burkholderiales bacterium]